MSHLNHSATCPRNRGFTLIELLIVITILSITGTLVISNYTSVTVTRLASTAENFVNDLHYAQVQSMAHGDDARVIVFDMVNHGYSIATASDTSTPITNPVGKMPFKVVFGKGRLSQLEGVQIAEHSVGDDNVLGFNVLGNIDQATPAVITFSSGNLRVDVTVDASTGLAQISNVY